tara:strand:- start:377 stop:3940 length:3564 start_codon:yes stop_codon:yes gene_type:complete
MTATHGSLKQKRLSNSFSTGGGGGHFEAHIQSSFIALMLTGGYAPCLPSWPIKEVKLQGKIDGYETDDLIVFVENSQTGEIQKLLGQVKHSISVTKGSTVFGEVIHAAWCDFNNLSIFNQGKDVLALITGPISNIDQQNVQWLLHHAKHTKNSVEFYRDVKQANFSPAKAEEKLSVIKHHLRVANGGIDVSDEELYQFLNHYHLLGYDIGGETGVVLPLLHSHISQFQHQSPKMVWSRIVDLVQTWNQHGGTITRDRLPDDLIEIFAQKVTVEKMPEELNPVKVKKETIWDDFQYRYELSLFCLLGGWNEKNENDIAVLCKLLNTDYEKLLPKARDILHISASPLKLKNGIWAVSGRKELLSHLGSQVFDSNLDNFKLIAESVLKEQDPSFELVKGQRYTASLHGKVLKHSGVIRQGIAEGLALLGGQSQLFTNCSTGKAETTAVLSVRGLINGASWQELASLNNLLTDLSEAAPTEFLSQIESALLNTPGVFENIFAQEDIGFSGDNYLTGLLWALEGLAWEEQYLVRVCSTLAELSSIDPGGKWANRPANSITTILLPWLPQTLASVEKRKVAVKTIVTNTAQIGWKLLLKLLPNQHQTSSGSYKPKWRKTIPDNWEKGVSKKEYWEQVSFYSVLAVESAGTNIKLVIELVDYFDHLAQPAFQMLIETLSSFDVQMLSDEEMRLIWDKLSRFTLKHRKFADAKWSLPNELLVPIESVTEKFAPTDPFVFYQYLFSNRDSELYEEKGNWEEQRKKLDEKRQNAIRELLAKNDILGVIKFAGHVSSPREVGHALGAIGDSEIDKILLLHLLPNDERKSQDFIGAYLWRRLTINGWKWADDVSKENWTEEEIGLFLSYLPFEQNAWDRAQLWLQDSEIEYWAKTPANGYQTEDDLNYAIKKLVEYRRPGAAIDCFGSLRIGDKPIDSELCIKALLAGINSDDLAHTGDQYNIVELIKYLQDDESVDEDGLFHVEWVYLPLLDGYHDATPTLLENKLANEPDFFCELIQLIYRAKNESENSNPLPEDKKAIAENAWKLLHHWHTPPGTQKNGEFKADLFESWLTSVKEVCKKSGRFEVAMITVGNVLIHAPEDESGLWIHRVVAAELNDKNSDDMRQGFSTGIFNSRGAYTVDPNGMQEKELADRFHQKAESIENEGYHRFAATLRDISERYYKEASRVIDEFKKDDDA